LAAMEETGARAFWAGPRDAIGAVLLAQRGHLFAWVPVMIGIGIGIFFGLRQEPQTGVLWAAGAAAAMLLLGARLLPEALRPLVVAGGLILGGLALAGLRAHLVAGPVLGFRYYGPVEGRVVAMDRSGSDAMRLTLDQVVLYNMSPERTPSRVRIALHGGAGGTARPGQIVMTTAHLSPPGGPVEPGGFDFQRHAWFLRLGAVGYTRVPVLRATDEAAGFSWAGLRLAMSERVQAALPGEPGGFAAAIITGDRSAMTQETLQALRVSNLAHLLAISGLHMGLLAGFVFAALRLIMACVPPLALRWPIRKFAAGGALAAAAVYLGLSGGNVATERAFVMVAVMLVAVMLDRRAISLRAVALAAIIVLALRPEAMLGPGFQMSFAATTALVAVFGRVSTYERGWVPGWLRPVTTVVISSLVAGLATAPFAAAHFNQIAHYGLLANLVSVPLMGVWVMPAAVLSVSLMPLGGEALGLWIMGLGLRWILGVAHWVAELDGARGVVTAPGPWVIPCLALGALFVILWQGKLRFFGLLPVVAGFWIWSGAERPRVLISEDGRLVGVMTEAGRALSRERGAGFVAMNWLENDGDAGDQVAAAARWEEGSAEIAGWDLQVLRGAQEVRGFDGCTASQRLVTPKDPDQSALPCQVFSPKSLRQSGAVALYLRKGEVKTITARQVSGTRLWNSRDIRRQ